MRAARILSTRCVATKEVRESLYWLRLIREAELFDGSVAELIDEANQLVAILTSSVRTAKRRAAARAPAEGQS